MNAKVIAVAAALLVVPTTAAANPQMTTVVEGHTVFVSLHPAGSDLAAIAGSVDCQVLWFNDQVLFRVPAGTSGLCGEARFVYAYPANAPDPRGNPTLRPTGTSYDFTDPNGMAWHVVEYGYKQMQVIVNQNLGLPDFIGENITIEQFDHVAWVVEAAEPVWEPTVKANYNFVTLVDTSKILLTEPGAVTHDGTPGGVAGGNSHDATDLDDGGRYPHRHDKSYVTLALGDAPPGYYGP